MTLHYRKSLLSGFCLAGLLIIFNSLPNDGLVYPQIINSGHALVFYCANLFLLNLLLGSNANYKKILTISIFSIVIGLLIECIQPYIGRDRSLLDFYYDIIGVLFSAVIYLKIHSTPTRHTAYLFIIFICLVSAFPAFRSYLWWQHNHTSTLVNFERRWEEGIYSIDKGVTLEKVPASDVFKETGYAGKLDFSISDTYLGFSLNYPRSDWRAFNKLSWEVASHHQQAVYMSLRIHDLKHNQEYSDRFNYRFKVRPGYNLFEVSFIDIKKAPKSRSMEMDSIQSVKFFLSKPDKATTLYLDNIQLH